MAYQATDVIKRLCKAADLPNAKALAAALGVRPATISEWKRKNRVDWHQVITTFPAVSIDELLGRAAPGTEILLRKDHAVVIVVDKEKISIR